MPTGIRFPIDLKDQGPERSGFSDTYEETRSRVEMEIGAARTRNLMRSTPRLFEVSFTFNYNEYNVFDNWWQNTILGGLHTFDIQLLDELDELVWFTVRWIGKYKASIDPSNNWVVTGSLRSEDESFEDRPPGTDELRGKTKITTKATGKIKIGKTVRGSATVELTGVGRLTPLPIHLYGTGSPELIAPARLAWPAILYGDANVEITGVGTLQIPLDLYGTATVDLEGIAEFDMPEGLWGDSWGDDWGG